MTILVSLLALAESGDLAVLREKARSAGPWVRLVDLLDEERTPAGARAKLGEVYLGRAPEEGKSRVITVDEIRRELERRGMEAEAFSFSGEKVEVVRRSEPWVGEVLRRAVAFEIKRLILEREPDPRPEEISVYVDSLGPGAGLEGFEVEKVLPRDPSRPEYTVTLARADGGRMEIPVTARILRWREAAFAAKDLGAARTLERSDVEMRLIEVSPGEKRLEDLSALTGARTLAKIRKGLPILPADVRLRPVVRVRDVVRACGPGYEVDGRALEDGAAGDEIMLEFPATKNRVRGKVAGPGSVTIAGGGR